MYNILFPSVWLVIYHKLPSIYSLLLLSYSILAMVLSETFLWLSLFLSLVSNQWLSRLLYVNFHTFWSDFRALEIQKTGKLNYVRCLAWFDSIYDSIWIYWVIWYVLVFFCRGDKMIKTLMSARAPVLAEKYSKEIENARRDLRALIFIKKCAPIMLSLAYVISFPCCIVWIYNHLHIDDDLCIVIWFITWCYEV